MKREDFIKAQKHLDDNFIRREISHKYYYSWPNFTKYLYTTNKNLYIETLYIPNESDLSIYYLSLKTRYLSTPNYLVFCNKNVSNKITCYMWWFPIYNIPFTRELNFIFKVRKIQRFVKEWYKKRSNAVRIIQQGCHNWLYSPKCRDGTIGIVPRLSLKNLNLI